MPAIGRGLAVDELARTASSPAPARAPSASSTHAARPGASGSGSACRSAAAPGEPPQLPTEPRHRHLGGRRCGHRTGVSRAAAALRRPCAVHACHGFRGPGAPAGTRQRRSGGRASTCRAPRRARTSASSMPRGTLGGRSSRIDVSCSMPVALAHVAGPAGGDDVVPACGRRRGCAARRGRCSRPGPPQYWQRWSSRANTERRFSGVFQRYGTRTKRRRRTTDGTATANRGECMTASLAWSISAVSPSTSTTARRSLTTQSGSNVALSTSARLIDAPPARRGPTAARGGWAGVPVVRSPTLGHVADKLLVARPLPSPLLR